MTTPKWTAQDEQLLRDMWKTHSSAIIAEKLGKSRSSVCGKAHRLGLKKKEPAIVVKKPKRMVAGPLSAEYEMELVEAWQDRGDIDARNRLIVAHDRLIKKLARKYWKGDRSDEFYSAAYIAAMRTADKYDRTKGARFSTYLVHWVRGFMQQHGKSVNKIASNERTTLNAPMGDDDGASAIDVLEDPNSRTQEDVIYIDELRRNIASVMAAKLTKREADVVAKRFFGDMLLQEVADEYGLTRERIRQLEKKALDKMKPHLRRMPIPAS